MIIRLSSPVGFLMMMGGGLLLIVARHPLLSVLSGVLIFGGFLVLAFLQIHGPVGIAVPRTRAKKNLRARKNSREPPEFKGARLELANIASAMILPRSEIEFGRYAELYHAVSNVFLDPQSGGEYTWNALGALLVHHDLLDRLLDWTIKSAGWDFDAICTVSNTGMPLAVLQGLRQPGKALLAVDSETFSFLPRDARPGERILLVDSIVQTGKHLEGVTEKIRRNGAEVVGAIVFCHNDMLLHDALKAKRPIVDSWIKQGKLIYLYKMSDLYKGRPGRGE